MNDYHIHTNLSLCADPAATVARYLEAGQARASVMGFSNHCWDAEVEGASQWYRQQDIAHVLSLRQQIPQTDGIHTFVGCEVEMRADLLVAMLPEHMDLFDYVLIPSSHAHMRGLTVPDRVLTLHELRELLIRRFCAAAETPLADYGVVALCHPFTAIGYLPQEHEILREISNRTFQNCFSIAAQRGIPIEINGEIFLDSHMPREEHDLPGEYVRMMSVATECGCRFYFGSDSHSPDIFLRHHSDERVATFARVCGFDYSDLVEK